MISLICTTFCRWVRQLRCVGEKRGLWRFRLLVGSLMVLCLGCAASDSLLGAARDWYSDDRSEEYERDPYLTAIPPSDPFDIEDAA